jgi:hypothetical protein
MDYSFRTWLEFRDMSAEYCKGFSRWQATPDKPTPSHFSGGFGYAGKLELGDLAAVVCGSKPATFLMAGTTHSWGPWQATLEGLLRMAQERNLTIQQMPGGTIVAKDADQAQQLAYLVSQIKKWKNRPENADTIGVHRQVGRNLGYPPEFIDRLRPTG